MPRTADPKKGRILHRTYRYAYLYERNEVWYMCVHTLRKTTHLKATKATQAQALRMLDDMLQNYLTPAERPKGNAPNLPSAIAEYIAVKKGKIADKTLTDIIRAFRLLLTHDVPLSDTQGIRAMIIENLKGLNYTPATVGFTLRKIRTFFAYCIDSGYMAHNPVTRTMLPDERKQEPSVPTTKQMNELLDACKDDKDFSRLVRLVMLTGMRLSEVSGLRVADIEPNGFWIDGKRSKFDVPKRRFFPFSVIQGVKELIDECVEHAVGARLFNHHKATHVLHIHKYAQKAGLGKSFTLHAVRRYALNRWEKELLLPTSVRNALAGHTSDVHSHYYQSPNAEEAERMMLSQLRAV